ncbi:MAG: polysaccharide deacetylase family protein [Candidatus Eisenbacteria bacterium]
MTRQPACLTFDIEDWHHPELVRSRVAAGDTRSVVRPGTERILEILARHRARATFFILGAVARSHPDLVRRIADEGHEIASHGDSHTSLWRLDRESFRAELRAFRQAVRDALGDDPARGFRAPTFSLDRSTAWALDVLLEEGFTYDSSIFPVKVKLYGVAGAPLGVYRPAAGDLARHDPGASLVEFPVAVHDVAGLRLPVAGGFYLRALPSAVFEGAFARVLAERPGVMFLHPWECAGDALPRVALPAVDSFITYHNLAQAPARLERLLARFGCEPMIDVLERAGHLARAA